MNEFRQQNKTMAFCSHSMFHVQELCDIAIWIEKGEIREMGDSHKVVGDYEDFCNNKKSYTSVVEDLPPHGSTAEETSSEDQTPSLQDCRINSLSVCNTDGEEITTIDALSDVVLEMEVEVLNDEMEGPFRVRVYALGRRTYRFVSHDQRRRCRTAPLLPRRGIQSSTRGREGRDARRRFLRARRAGR
jgi:ABC-type glutathione transport system ATPase component